MKKPQRGGRGPHGDGQPSMRSIQMSKHHKSELELRFAALQAENRELKRRLQEAEMTLGSGAPRPAASSKRARRATTPRRSTCVGAAS
jgi:hypothetical protein